jgi:hypothetical protein
LCNAEIKEKKMKEQLIKILLEKAKALSYFNAAEGASYHAETAARNQARIEFSAARLNAEAEGIETEKLLRNYLV